MKKIIVIVILLFVIGICAFLVERNCIFKDKFFCEVRTNKEKILNLCKKQEDYNSCLKMKIIEHIENLCEGECVTEMKVGLDTIKKSWSSFYKNLYDAKESDDIVQKQLRKKYELLLEYIIRMHELYGK